MAEKFGFGEEQARRCPGEHDCERYASAAGATTEEKARACIGCGDCRGLAPLSDGENAEDEFDGILDEMEQIVWQQRAGRRFSLREFSPEQWLLLTLRHGLESEFEKAAWVRTARLLEAIAGMAK